MAYLLNHKYIATNKKLNSKSKQKKFSNCIIIRYIDLINEEGTY